MNLMTNRKAYMKAYIAAHKDRITEQKRLHRRAHKAEYAAWLKKWVAKNPERNQMHKHLWYKRNAKQVLAQTRKYQLSKLHRTPKFGQSGITDFYKNCPVDMVVDHVYPLQAKEASGLHVIWNLQYLSPHENCSKRNTMPSFV